MKHPGDYITESQARAIINNACNIKYKALFSILWDTGARIGEVLKIRKKDIDKDKCMITMPIEKRKGNLTKTVPVTKETMDLIEEYLKRWRVLNRNAIGDEKELLFPCSYKTVYEELEVMCRKAGVKFGRGGVHFHSFRHGFAVRFIKKCFELGQAANPYYQMVLRDILGHSSVSMTEKYVHVPTDMMKSTYNKIIGNKGDIDDEDKGV